MAYRLSVENVELKDSSTAELRGSLYEGSCCLDSVVSAKVHAMDLHPRWRKVSRSRAKMFNEEMQNLLQREIPVNARINERRQEDACGYRIFPDYASLRRIIDAPQES